MVCSLITSLHNEPSLWDPVLMSHRVPRTASLVVLWNSKRQISGGWNSKYLMEVLPVLQSLTLRLYLYPIIRHLTPFIIPSLCHKSETWFNIHNPQSEEDRIGCRKFNINSKLGWGFILKFDFKFCNVK